jgi:SAM-dependent methyltransferase
MASDAVDTDLLEEQLEYYRQRAAEYDEWWERRGRYDRGPEINARWRAEIQVVRDAFDGLPLDGHVLELAPGTGYWTELLAGRAERVTALDGSAEMIALNRARLGDLAAKVEYLEVNLFDWEPSQRWEGLVFCFWISHVPRDQLVSFLSRCRRALTEGAPVFFLDGQRVEESTAMDHVLPDPDSEVMVRRLNDGREFRIVKNFHEPEEIVAAAAAAGIGLDVRRTATYFQFGIGAAR